MKQIIQYLRNHDFNGDHSDLLNTHEIMYPLIICQHWFMLVSRIQLQSNSSNSVLISAKLPLALHKSYSNSCSYSFCFSSHTYNNENTSVPLSFVPGDKWSIPDTTVMMLSSFTSTRPSRLEVCLSLFLVGFLPSVSETHPWHIQQTRCPCCWTIHRPI